VLRFFNTYGTRQTDTPYVGVISIFIRRLLRGQPVVVFGTGQQCRDFVHVSDIVAANVAALDAETDACVCNVGTGRATSVGQIAALLTARLAPHQMPQTAPAQAGELQNCVADVSTAARLLGYHPRARLEDRIGEVIEYLRGQAVASA
jgi:nucleoside-diphosphate-sugar epimerase